MAVADLPEASSGAPSRNTVYLATAVVSAVVAAVVLGLWWFSIITQNDPVSVPKTPQAVMPKADESGREAGIKRDLPEDRVPNRAPAKPVVSPRQPEAAAVAAPAAVGNEQGGVIRRSRPPAGFDRPSPPTFSGDIPDYEALPMSLRDILPPLQLSGHLYSFARPQARKVIIDGLSLRENQHLDDDLMVRKIVPDGVVLDFQGQLFKLSADRIFR